jgi:transcriptional regulator with XRE-family HTH domain
LFSAFIVFVILTPIGIGAYRQLVQERDVYKAFGQTIANLRSGRLTQLQLARTVGISRASLANIERGEQRVYLHQLLALSDALGVTLTDLLPTGQRFQPIAPAKVSVSGDKINRAQTRAIKELVSAITLTTRRSL